MAENTVRDLITKRPVTFELGFVKELIPGCLMGEFRMVSLVVGNVGIPII